MASRTGVVGLDAFFAMEEIYNEYYCKEGEKKCKAEIFPSLLSHVILVDNI